MTPSGVLYLVLIPACLVVGAIGFAAWQRPDSRPMQLGSRVAAGIAAALAVLAFILRTVEAEHLPLFGTYESALSLAATTLVVSLVMERATRWAAGLLAPAAMVSAAVLLHGLGYSDDIWALTISERSWVVDVHAFVAWATFGVLAGNAGIAMRVLVVRDVSERADKWLATSLSLGFLLHTAMLASGSIYKFLLFGKAWSWDPIEILGALAWFAYGTLLHLHLFAHWRGRKLAGWAIFLFVVLVISYRGIVYFPPTSTYHILDIDLRLHLME